jgi:hypothetical protein
MVEKHSFLVTKTPNQRMLEARVPEVYFDYLRVDEMTDYDDHCYCKLNGTLIQARAFRLSKLSKLTHSTLTRKQS